MKEYYIPALEKYVYHIFCVYICSKNICGRMKSEGCFAVRVKFCLFETTLNVCLRISIWKTRSDHCENGRSSSIEGCNIEFVDEYHNAQSEFNSYLLDNSRQDTSITRAHMISMLKELEKGNKLNRICIIWESIDGCCKQYRCGASLCLLFYFRLTLILLLIEWYVYHDMGKLS